MVSSRCFLAFFLVLNVGFFVRADDVPKPKLEPKEKNVKQWPALKEEGMRTSGSSPLVEQGHIADSSMK